jgi:hypothetical protein
MEDMKTMDYQLIIEYLEDNPNIAERGFWNDLTAAVEVADQIDDIPTKFGYPKCAKAEIIQIVTEEPSKWAKVHTIYGYAVVVHNGC